MTTPLSNPVTLFKNALVFDGTASMPVHGDVLVAHGRVSQIASHIAAPEGAQLIDCEGKWLMPGLLDIHTHLDLEVELAPELGEAVRHGSTTVVMSNCSLGVAYGNQRRNGEDPITSCFARVENIPKHVLERVGDACTWSTSAEYLDHFKSMNLGPNVVPLIPHSMLRIEVMGLKDSVTRDPSDEELKKMEGLLDKAMQEGYPGFSTDGLPFHYLANQPHTRKQIPTQFASYKELRKLTGIVRKYDRVWQATPPKDSPLRTVRNFLLTSAWFAKRPLKVTATAAIDLYTNSGIAMLGLTLSRLLNSFLVRGHFRFQALSASFRIWSDGVITPVAEEIPELRVLNELELDDREGRFNILNDPAWINDFRTMWFKGKKGFNIHNLKRLLNREDNVLNRKLDHMLISDCPLPEWNGQSMDKPYGRLLAWQKSGAKVGALSPAEDSFFRGLKNPIVDDAEFFLELLRKWDTALRWETTVANRNPAVTKKLLFHPLTLPGFNDSGAHLTNLAFYDGNLRTLKMALEDGYEKVATAVNRLTKLPAEFFGLNAGVLAVGAQADICVVDPKALAKWDPEQTYEFIQRDLFHSRQVVNRPVGVVTQVMVGGKLAWTQGEFTEQFGQEQFGRLLRAKDHELEKQQMADLAQAAPRLGKTAQIHTLAA